MRLPRPWNSPGKNTGVGCHFLLQCRKVKSESEVSQSYPTLSNPTDCSPPGSFVHGIFQARVLEWVATAVSRWAWEEVKFTSWEPCNAEGVLLGKVHECNFSFSIFWKKAERTPSHKATDQTVYGQLTYSYYSNSLCPGKINNVWINTISILYYCYFPICKLHIS